MTHFLDIPHESIAVLYINIFHPPNTTLLVRQDNITTPWPIQGDILVIIFCVFVCNALQITALPMCIWRSKKTTKTCLIE